jgi:hypothetical protein
LSTIDTNTLRGVLARERVFLRNVKAVPFRCIGYPFPTEYVTISFILTSSSCETSCDAHAFVLRLTILRRIQVPPKLPIKASLIVTFRII